MKIKYLIIVLLLLMSSCKDKTHRMNNSNYSEQIYEVTYKGHDYIVFSGNVGDSYGYKSGCDAGVVHNPECRKCKLNKKDGPHTND